MKKMIISIALMPLLTGIALGMDVAQGMHLKWKYAAKPMKIDEPTQEPMSFKKFADVANVDAFTNAAAAGDFDGVMDWIIQNIDVNMRDSQGETALHKAASNGHVAILMLLLDHGANIDRPDKRGITPVGAAIIAGSRPAAEYLIDREARNDIPDKYGRTPENLRQIIIQIINNVQLSNIVRDLLNQNIDLVDARSLEGLPLLQHAILGGNIDSIIAFLDHGANILERNHHGLNALHVAAKTGNANIVGLIMQAAQRAGELEAAVNARDRINATPLHYAVAANNPQSVQYLVTAGADVNAQTVDGETPLHLASKRAGDVAIFQILENAGAQFALKTRQGQTAEELAQPENLKRFIKGLHHYNVVKKFRGEGKPSRPSNKENVENVQNMSDNNAQNMEFDEE